MSQSRAYKPVTVDAAKGIAEEFNKDIVIIACWDEEHKLLHTTTYGKDALHKCHAASGGEIVAKALGGDLLKSTEYEDFRKDFDAGKYRALQEKAMKARAMLEPLANQVIPNVMTIRAVIDLLL